jgi:hypothetical protein
MDLKKSAKPTIIAETIRNNLKQNNNNIYTRGICIYTSSSQEIFLPRLFVNTLGKMQLPQVIADLFKIWKMRDFWNTPGKARVYLG